MHSSYRSTFRTLGDIPLAMVDEEHFTPIHDDFARRRPDRNSFETFEAELTRRLPPA